MDGHITQLPSLPSHALCFSASGWQAGGETALYTSHIAKDQRTDQTWSQLGGHIMFKDPTLEENIGKYPMTPFSVSTKHLLSTY